MKNRERNIGIVAFPICGAGDEAEDTKAAGVPFSNLVDILHDLYDNLYVVTGNKARVLYKKDKITHISEVRHSGGAGTISRIMNYILTQVRLSLELARLSKKVSLWIFFIGAEALVLPVLTARLWRRQVVVALSGFPAKVSQEEKTRLFKMVDVLQRISLALANRIVVYSERIVAEHNLSRYGAKISIAPRHFLDFSKFRIERPLTQRDNLVAYIGRLSEGKGIPNLLEAITEVSSSRSDISFLIGGDGPLQGLVKEYLDSPGLKNRARFPGWIPHHELSGYLNETKLLILPSYTEALPNIILEAMACGTPVLATAVGAIPDLIKDGETGFIMEMEDNTADGIARNIVRALGHPDLENIADNARTLVENGYTYEAAVARYKKILAVVNSEQENP